ncbi:transcriptional regulator [Pseudoalteromonas phenolica]|uniref:Transcriptional regulator n=1 Tax=Pseudoalteromonas phenolica TaxID=161398 RepID=A0A4Q7IS41_9GAMM|nr:ChrR family anti-sigma-E factor [Pseudoalteromonas phenolica]RZQ54870.1 transcriptional regulator [Pseudoalteromonas phenolica]
MIKHHPKLEMLESYVAGELPASVNIMIAAHIEMCPKCQQQVTELTSKAADSCFDFDTLDVGELELQFDFDSFVDDITQYTYTEEIVESEIQEITVADTPYCLPQVLRNIERSNWMNLGKLSRSRFELEDGDLRMSLLHIDAEGSVPNHTHNGFEITLLVDGSFEDEMGTYQRGDFIWLDGNNTHTPVTKDGCLCLTVSSDSLHFTQGLSKLLNPIGKFIY